MATFRTRTGRVKAAPLAIRHQVAASLRELAACLVDGEPVDPASLANLAYVLWSHQGRRPEDLGQARKELA